jgi:DNA-binding transcriptional ArsR family regulator
VSYRIGPEDVFRGRRGEIYECIRTEPGINFLKLVERFGLHYGATDYHLHVLERHKKVVGIKAGKFRRYYATGVEDYWALRIRAAISDPNLEKTIRVIQSNPGIHQRPLCERFPEVTRQAVSYRVSRLIDVGAVRAQKEGATTYYNLSHEGGYVLDRPVGHEPANVENVESRISEAADRETEDDRRQMERANDGSYWCQDHYGGVEVQFSAKDERAATIAEISVESFDARYRRDRHRKGGENE